MRIFALLGCCWLMASCTPTSTNEPLRIGINPWPGYEFLYLAQEVGIYKRLGLNVKLIEYGALEDVVQGFKRGNLDITCTTLAEVAHIHQSGGTDLRAFIYADYSNGSDMLVAQSNIATIDDLNGKRVGIEPGTISQILLHLAVQSSANPATWKATIIEDSQDNLVRRFADGEVDAIATYPPFAISARKTAGTHVLFDSAKAPGQIVDVIAARESLLKSRETEIGLLKQAWQEAVEYYEQHPDEAIKIMAARERITAADFKSALDGIKYLSLTDQQRLVSSGTVRNALNTTLHVVYGGNPPDTAKSCCLAAP